MSLTDSTSEVRLWLSAAVLPPEGGAIVMCLVNDSDSEFSCDTPGEVEVLSNGAWEHFGGFQASNGLHGKAGSFWSGYLTGRRVALGNKLVAKPFGTGQPPEYLAIPVLEPGRYRVVHLEDRGSREQRRLASGNFEVRLGAASPVPVEFENFKGSGLLLSPIVVPPSGAVLTMQATYRNRKDPPRYSHERVIRGLEVGIRVQAWKDDRWSEPVVILAPRQLIEHRSTLAVDLPALPAGPYRLSCDHPDLGEIGRVVWVVDGLPGETRTTGPCG